MKSLKLAGGIIAATAVMSLFGAACGGDEEPTPTATTRPATPTATRTATTSPTAATSPTTTTPGTGDAVKGQVVFNSKGCAGCHSVGTSAGAGPGLGGIATTAATRRPGMTAQAYIEESELTPSAFIVPGFTAVTMPPLWTSKNDAGFADLIAYLMTLK